MTDESEPDTELLLAIFQRQKAAGELPEWIETLAEFCDYKATKPGPPDHLVRQARRWISLYRETHDHVRLEDLSLRDNASYTQIIEWAARFVCDGRTLPGGPLIRVAYQFLEPQTAVVWALCERAGLPIAQLILDAAPRVRPLSSYEVRHGIEHRQRLLAEVPDAARQSLADAAMRLIAVGNPLGNVVARWIGDPGADHVWTLDELGLGVGVPQ